MRYLSSILCGILMTLHLTGCGGGGGGSISPIGTGTPQAGTVTFSGIVAKGPVRGATVRVYAIPASGDLNARVISGTTISNDRGEYSISVAGGSGLFLVEASGGTYYDEALLRDVPLASPLRTLVANASGPTTVAVTPLTELAVQLAGTSLSAQRINDCHGIVADIFETSNIVGVLPVSLATAAQASTAGRAYTFNLATFSQLAAVRGQTMAQVIAALRDEIVQNNNRLTLATVTAYTNALTSFLASPGNVSGITAVSSTGLADVGTVSRLARLATRPNGTFSGSFITGIQLSMGIPAGVEIVVAANGDPAVVPSGVAATGTTIAANFVAASQSLNLAEANVNGFGLGEFATVTLEISPGAYPIPADFPITVTTVTTTNGVDIASYVTIYLTL